MAVVGTGQVSLPPRPTSENLDQSSVAGGNVITSPSRLVKLKSACKVVGLCHMHIAPVVEAPR